MDDKTHHLSGLTLTTCRASTDCESAWDISYAKSDCFVWRCTSLKVDLSQRINIWWGHLRKATYACRNGTGHGCFS